MIDYSTHIDDTMYELIARIRTKSLHILRTNVPFQFGYICVWQITPHFAAIQCLGDDHIFIDGSRGQGIQVFGCMPLLHILRKVPRSLQHASCMRRCVDKYLSYVIPRWVYWSTISICCCPTWNECLEWPLSGLLIITTAHLAALYSNRHFIA